VTRVKLSADGARSNAERFVRQPRKDVRCLVFDYCSVERTILHWLSFCTLWLELGHVCELVLVVWLLGGQYWRKRKASMESSFHIHASEGTYFSRQVGRV
jgi:hypothetical protein